MKGNIAFSFSRTSIVTALYPNYFRKGNIRFFSPHIFHQAIKNSITINSARWRRSSWYFQEEFPSFQVHLLLHHSACQAPSLLMAKNLTSISYRMQSRTTMCNLQFLASCSPSSSMEGHQRLPLPQVPQSLRWISECEVRVSVFDSLECSWYDANKRHP